MWDGQQLLILGGLAPALTNQEIAEDLLWFRALLHAGTGREMQAKPGSHSLPQAEIKATLWSSAPG